MKRLIQFIRSKFFQKERKLYAYTFLVNISLEHPQVMGGPIVKHRMAIDANSKAHARSRLQSELRIVVGQARRTSLRTLIKKSE